MGIDPTTVTLQSDAELMPCRLNFFIFSIKLKLHKIIEIFKKGEPVNLFLR